ncbi:MAG: DUF2309 domain-containing protein [Flavobacteriales bacterium]|nr:DUF2309 domain-containing protein [Flavobacteriales bacterium]
MKKSNDASIEDIINNLKHFLPSQAPLKDFIHHNTLHAFQISKFHDGLAQASEIFGWKTYLQLSEYRERYNENKISEKALDWVLENRSKDKSEWKQKLLIHEFNEHLEARIGRLRGLWRSEFKIDLDSMVHPILFRTISSYLDQGIAIWNFPVDKDGFLASLRKLERTTKTSFFKGDLAKQLLLNESIDITYLLEEIVGDERYFETYLFDQQFSHPGWSGIVAVIDNNPNALLDRKPIKLTELIHFELLLEIDVLNFHYGKAWPTIGHKAKDENIDLFSDVEKNEVLQTQAIWQDAMEITYYNEVLNGIQKKHRTVLQGKPSFQAIYCIDDRECSFRRYTEELAPTCITYGAAGFFNAEFYYQPIGSDFYTKVCPAPVTPKHLIREIGTKTKIQKDIHFNKYSQGLFTGWIISQFAGLWSGIQLAKSIIFPSQNASSVSSFKHMHKDSSLTIEHEGEFTKDGLQVGYTIEEMADRLEGLLRTVGMIENFAPLIYAIGHGSSSVNNTHYAGYDCGACSGRPGSVNARVICHIGNHPEVRKTLKERGILIPDETQFVGALHDTSRDEIAFYDEGVLTTENSILQQENKVIFANALDLNAKERSRRFVVMNNKRNAKKVHEEVKLRTVSLFEPRPELNHATNTLCIVGRRGMTKGLFLDRRAFLHSYDYTTDPDGNYLLGIMNAIAPVCGGINLEYYFSRVDNQNLGAGTKLPHNVMGLFGVANGIDGDLRTGLPSQMIEVHDPIRLLAIVEHHPEVVLKTIKKNPATYEWFANEWVNLVAYDSKQNAYYLFRDGGFKPYELLDYSVSKIANVEEFIQTSHDNLPITELIN